MAKKCKKEEQELQQEEKQEVEAQEAQEEAPAEVNPFEEKYNAEHDSYLRLAADYDNFRKRTTREKEQSYSNGRADAGAKHLPVSANLARALNQPTQDEAY